MKKAPIIRPLLALVVLGAIIGSYLRGRNDVWVSEFKGCQAAMIELTYWETNQPAELKEYVKAHYYYLGNKIPKSWCGNPCDYGSVSTNVQHLAVFKGPTSGQAEYLEFLRRYDLPKK